jgi:hypothetical protein
LIDFIRFIACGDFPFPFFYNHVSPSGFGVLGALLERRDLNTEFRSVAHFIFLFRTDVTLKKSRCYAEQSV